MLILYHPWREECDLIKDYSSAEASFQAKGINSVLSNNNFSKQVESAVFTIQSHNDIIVNDYIVPFIAPNIEANENDILDKEIPPLLDSRAVFDIGSEDVVSLETDDTSVQCSGLKDILKGCIEGDDTLTIESMSMSDECFNKMVHSLNHEQLHVFNYINGKLTNQSEPFCFFVSGPGGTGKSYLIKVLMELVHRHYQNRNSTITTAPTGVAAYNIQGSTLHRSLSLLLEHKAILKYNKLNGEKLALMKKNWHSINNLIIDEISMVSYETLLHINLRLAEIKNIASPSIIIS